MHCINRLLTCENVLPFDLDFFFAIELPRETLYVLLCVRFPCQMTKRFIYAVDIYMLKKDISLRYQ